MHTDADSCVNLMETWSVLHLLVARDRPGGHRHCRPGDASAASDSWATDCGVGKELHRVVAWGTAGQ